MKISKSFLLPLPLGLLLVVLTIGFASAQEDPPPRSLSPDAPQAQSNFIPVQGRLTDSSGLPINGTYTLTFRLYDEYSGGAALCQDPSYYVHVDHGLFNTYMDAYGCSIDGRQLYLGVEVEDDGEMTPRQYIDNVPYAWGLRPGAIISATMGNNAILHIENWAANGRGLRSYAQSQSGTNYGIVGASRSPDGFGGYFYNNGGGVALSASSVGGIGLSVSSENAFALLAESTNEDALWATSTNGAGVHGASAAAPGVEGFSLLGPGVYGESLDGAAIAANGVITSSEETYLWVSGNDVRPAGHLDSTYIDLNSRGGARIYRGADPSYKNVILPITIAGTLYGQNVKLTELELYWKGDTQNDAITTIRLRRQTGVCNSCYSEIIADLTDYTCFEDDNLQGCTITDNLVANNILDSQSGILYLTLELGFGGTTWIDFDGVRLTLEYDD